MTKERLGKIVFSLRSYTPIPFLLAALVWSRVSWGSYFSGLALVISGEAVRLWAVSIAGPMTRMKNVGAAELITAGPFAHTRNPLYSGNFLIGCGFCIMSWALMPWLLMGFVFAFFVQYSLIVLHEEEFLKEKFGVKYSEYAHDVPGIFPRFNPYKKRSGPVPSIVRGLKSERRTLQTIVLLLVLFIARRLLQS
ncbi:MAG: isoprenylcysteine carboxylmethyltransferase family protein [Candidatus Eisenbacteria bacterium]|nr:isoprenylcysteine carboxylmethyltransferase family protein [Candidatus Eisenbacteria bacterium]